MSLNHMVFNYASKDNEVKINLEIRFSLFVQPVFKVLLVLKLLVFVEKNAKSKVPGSVSSKIKASTEWPSPF